MLIPLLRSTWKMSGSRMMFWILQQCIPPAVDFMGKVPEMEIISSHGDSLFFWPSDLPNDPATTWVL